MPVISAFRKTLLNSQPLPTDKNLNPLTKPPIETFSGVNFGFSDLVERQAEIEQRSLTPNATPPENKFSISSLRPEIVSTFRPFDTFSLENYEEKLSILSLEAKIEKNDIDLIFSRINSQITGSLEVKKVENISIASDLVDKYFKIANVIDKTRKGIDFYGSSNLIYASSKNMMMRSDVSRGPRSSQESSNVIEEEFSINRTFLGIDPSSFSNTVLFRSLATSLMLPSSIIFSNINTGRFSSPFIYTPVHSFLDRLSKKDVSNIDDFISLESSLPSGHADRIQLLSEALSFELTTTSGCIKNEYPAPAMIVINDVGYDQFTPSFSGTSPTLTNLSVIKKIENDGIIKSIFILDPKNYSIGTLSYYGSLESFIEPAVTDPSLGISFHNAASSLYSKAEEYLDKVSKIRSINIENPLSPTKIISECCSKIYDSGNSTSQQSSSKIEQIRQLAIISNLSSIITIQGIVPRYRIFNILLAGSDLNTIRQGDNASQTARSASAERNAGSSGVALANPIIQSTRGMSGRTKPTSQTDASSARTANQPQETNAINILTTQTFSTKDIRKNILMGGELYPGIKPKTRDEDSQKEKNDEGIKEKLYQASKDTQAETFDPKQTLGKKFAVSECSYEDILKSIYEFRQNDVSSLNKEENTVSDIIEMIRRLGFRSNQNDPAPYMTDKNLYQEFFDAFPKTNDASNQNTVTVASFLSSITKPNTVATKMNDVYLSISRKFDTKANTVNYLNTSKTFTYQLDSSKIKFIIFELICSILSFLKSHSVSSFEGQAPATYSMSMQSLTLKYVGSDSALADDLLYLKRLSEHTGRFSNFSYSSKSFSSGEIKNSMKNLDVLNDILFERYHVIRSYLRSYLSSISDFNALMKSQDIIDFVQRVKSLNKYDTIKNSSIESSTYRKFLFDESVNIENGKYLSQYSYLNYITKNIGEIISHSPTILAIGLPEKSIEELRRSNDIPNFFSERYIEIEVSKRNLQIDLPYFTTTLRFFPFLEVIPRISQESIDSNASSLGVWEISKEFDYLIYNSSSSSWEKFNRDQALTIVIEKTGLTKSESLAILLNHILDSIYRLVHYVSFGTDLKMVGSGLDNMMSKSGYDFFKTFSFLGNLYVDVTIDQLVEKDNATKSYRILPYSDLKKEVISKIDQSTHRMLTFIMKKFVFKNELIVSSFINQIPFERVYFVGLCSGDFLINNQSISEEKNKYQLDIRSNILDQFGIATENSSYGYIKFTDKEILGRMISHEFSSRVSLVSS